MLLLAQAHELVVDLLRRLDPVGGLLLGGVRRWRSGGSGVGVALNGGGCGCWRGSGCRGLGLRRRLWRVGLGCFGLPHGWLVGSGVVEAGGVGVRWRRAAHAWGEDQFCRRGGGVLDDDHVAGGAVEEGCEHLGRGCGAVLAEDALVGYAAGDLDAGLMRDLAEYLVEAGVAGRDGEQTAGVGDPGALCGCCAGVCGTGGGVWVGCVAGIIEAAGGAVGAIVSAGSCFGSGCAGLDWACTSVATEMQVATASRIGRELGIYR